MCARGLLLAACLAASAALLWGAPEPQFTPPGTENLHIPCRSQSDCASKANTECSAAGQCVCLENHGPLNASACGRLVGHRCDDGVCDAIDSECYESECTCRAGYTVNSKANICYRKPENFGDWCDQPNECRFLSDGGECRDDRCQCLPGFTYVYKDRRCKYIIGLGGTCHPNNQACYLQQDGDDQKVDCVDGVCQCTPGGSPSADKRSCNGDSGGGATLASTSGVALLLLLAPRAVA